MFNTIVLFPLINFLVIFTHLSIAEQDDIQPNNAPSSLRDLRRAPQRTEEVFGLKIFFYFQFLAKMWHSRPKLPTLYK